MSSQASSRSTVGGRKRNPRGQGQQLRSEIVSVARLLLDEAGEDAVTLRAVARRVGISAPSIYAHFVDRDAILLAVAADTFAELAAYLRAAGDTAASAPAAVQLRAVCEGYLRFARDHPALYRVMFGGVWDGTRAVAAGSVTREEVATLGADALDVFAQALARRDEAENNRGDDLAAAASMVWVGLHGLAHQRLVAPSFPWPDGIESRLISALVSSTS